MAIPYPHFIGSEKPPMETGILVPTSSSSSPSSSSPSPVILTQDELKKIAAYKAVEYVESNMVLGLGTGSTAKHAVERIAELLHQGKLHNIVGIPTSKMTHDQAVSLGIPLSDLDSHPSIDLAIDGADEVDPFLNLVKGRGGSLLREKMVESACRKFVVIVDESKLVNHLGGSGLAMPVEVIPFCWKFTARRLQNLFLESGCVAKLRTFPDSNQPFVTDNKNYIVDLYFNKDIGDLKVASDEILRLAGVVEHGMFLDMATTVIVAGELGVTVQYLKGVASPSLKRAAAVWVSEKRCKHLSYGLCVCSKYFVILKGFQGLVVTGVVKGEKSACTPSHVLPSKLRRVSILEDE